MSTITIAVGLVGAIAGAGAMWIPARMERETAQLHNNLAERKLTECEQRDAAYEESRTLQPFWSFDAPAELPAAEHEGEVLLVEHPTGELRVLSASDPAVAAGLARLADEVGLVQALNEPNRCPECCLLSAHKPLCSRPVALPWEQASAAMANAYALSDRPAEDEDEVGEEQPGEAWFAGVVERWRRLVAWLRQFGQSRRERHLIGSGEQATAEDPFAELLAHVETRPYVGRHWSAGTEHTGAYKLVVPAQRDGGDDA